LQNNTIYLNSKHTQWTEPEIHRS